MAEPSVKARDESRNDYFTEESPNENHISRRTVTTDEENIQVVIVDELTVKKIILDKPGLHEVIFTKSESTKKSSESTTKFLTKSGRGKFWKSETEKEQNLKFRKNEEKNNGTREKSVLILSHKGPSKLPIWRPGKNKNISILNGIKGKVIENADNPSERNIKSDRFNSNITTICKVPPPIIPPKPYKNTDDNTNNNTSEQQNITENTRTDQKDFDKRSEDTASSAIKRLENSQNKIEQLQKNLVKINSITAESYKQKLPISHPNISKVSSVSDIDLNKNTNKAAFDKEFLAKHNLNQSLEVDKTGFLETDIDYNSDSEKVINTTTGKPRYSKEVSEIEKRWSGEFLESRLEPSSSGSSKSSYVEEIGSVSSHESVIEHSVVKPYNLPFQLHQEKNNQDFQKRTFDEILEDTVSTIESTKCANDRTETGDDYSDDNGSNCGTLKQSSINIDSNENEVECCQILECEKVVISNDEFDDTDEEKTDNCNHNPDFSNEEREYIQLQKVIITKAEHGDNLRSDGYAELIKEIIMEPGPSKGKDEKKKKGGLRRLLPGIFSPKDSRKEYKKEHKERKKRDERHFNQHQQNGIYMRSPDTMHLNEDIKRNVNLDTSLNGTIIEERLNEIKQELFPDQGMTTSTPDHFLQSNRDHVLGRRTPRLYTANSSLSSIAVEDKWIDQNIISGSPDMRKFKQHVRNENDRKCNLERKHSFQESQPRFVRNHGPSGRISAPPSERFLIRPRAVHPMDRPLPAIPQKVEFTNYQNHEEIRKHPNSYTREDVVNYQPETYYPKNQKSTNEAELYENGHNMEKIETNRNQSIDSGFNMTPVSAQMKINRQLMNNQNGQKIQCGIRRSPKYSPSSSQKSGDYADSSYTPNSSQKSEFSPGSSKSGEYYLNSPRNSSRVSPDYSINDRHDQPDRESTKYNSSYQVPSNMKVQVKDDRIYNETQKSPESDKSQSSPRVILHNSNHDTACVQRGSPNIPLSSNLAKLRANVGTSSRSQSPRNLNERIQSVSPITTTQTPVSPNQSASLRDTTKSPSLSSPTIVMTEQRFTSPLTIITPASPVMSNSTASPDGRSKSRSGTPSSSGLMSPTKIAVHIRESQYRTPISSPTMNQMRNSSYPQMSSFQPRKAQPTDQILIASPKRESIYDPQPHRPSSRMEPSCPDSPVSMVDSPCYSVSPRQNLQTTVAVRLSNTKIPEKLEVSEQLPPEAFRDEPIQGALSRSLSPQSADRSVQRPEPIYVKRQSLQKRLSPDKVNLDRIQASPSVDGRANMLLIQVKPGNTEKVDVHPNPEVPLITEAQETTGVNLQPVRATSSQSMSPEVRKVSHVTPDYGADRLQLRQKDGSPSHERPHGIYGNQKLVVQNPNTSIEDIYGKHLQQSPIPSQMRSPGHQYQQKYEVVVQQHSTPSQEKPRQQPIYSSKQEAFRQNLEEIYGKRVAPKEPIYSHSNRKAEPIYGQRNAEPIYGQNSNKPLSPSKKETRQHLEAFYWQQKALETQKTTSNSSHTSIKPEESESPEVREAIYWHQLKKLNEEQQRKIYEQNQFDERNDPIYWKKKIQNSASSPTVHPNKQGSCSSLMNQKQPTTQVQIEHRPENPEQVYWRTHMQPSSNPSAKPPLSGQKGQNQPVLVVRPQQTVRESNQLQSNSMQDPKQLRSKSVSPHFVRNDERRSLQLPRKSGMTMDDEYPERNNVFNNTRKSMTPPIYDENDMDKKQPPPIFKRGSLISNSSSSVEYGTMGTKRVSFSNQSHSPEIGSGNWPTKHGMAPEPPTRKHRTEEESSSDATDHRGTRSHEQDSNSVNNIYGNTVPCAPRQIIYETEYDANKPLPPPPPPNDLWMMKRNNIARDNKHQQFEVQRANVPASPRKLMIGISESESGSEAGEVQRILHRRNEEEWNPGGKGRQSNETGGLGRAEGEGGSNDLPSGRRSGGAGVLGSVVGGRSTGTSGGGGGRSRDEPRRHTLSGDHAPSLHHQQFNAQQFPLHPHHLPLPHGQYGTPTTRHTTMDLEMGTKSRQRKSPLPRGYPPPSTAMLFDDDPGIMSEVETSSTGFRRGGKQRSSLPVVRTPSKTLERPLGLVFLQYRKETKRALLPNEITSIDTVKALFVRSFPKQLTMEYLDSPDVKVYIHDSNKDMFYELEDHRSHLRDIRDRSVLRLIEKTDGIGGISGPLGAPVGGPPGLPPHWEDQSYFSEPEFDSEFQHQHIHKSKTSKNSSSGNYYMGGSSTLPRGGSIMRAYSPAASAILAGPNATPTPQKALGTPDRLHGESGYMSSPERGGGVGSGTGRYPGPYSTGSSYEEPYYSQYSGTVTPVIDEEARIRVEHMERQLANLTGLVQKALTHAPHTSPSPRDYLQIPGGRDPYARNADKSVSFEKSVSFSDEPPDMNSPKQHSPQHTADTKPTKPAIKSSTLPRMSSQERDRHKPPPPPKPVALAAGQYVYRDLALTPEMYNQLRGLQKKAKDLRQEVRNLRRMSQAQAHTVRETIWDTFITIRAMLLSGGDAAWAAGDTEKIKLSREEDLYKQEMIRLEKDLTELESTVEELRGNVITRKTRVNMSDVENMALILSKSSKTIADLKVRFPGLQEGMKGLLSSEMEKVVREEKFLKEEPDRLESALRRCKKLTSTLVTLKRLASVQEQRLPNAASIDLEETPPITPTSAQHSKTTAPLPTERTGVGSTGVIGGGSYPLESSTAYQQRPENALDALLDELQTFSRPSSQLSQVSCTSQTTNHTPNMLELGRSASQVMQSSGRAPNISDIGRKGSIDSSSSLAIVPPTSTNTLRRLHSYPSSSDTDTSPPIARIQVSDGTIPPQKPPVPERNAELLQLATARRVPPPPPPRTSSRSPLASPTSPQLPPRNPTGTLRRGRPNAKDCGKPPMALPPNAAIDEHNQKPIPTNNILSASNSSSCESINSQEGLQNKKERQEQLEQRHQELLRKQKALQEQYARLQELQRNASGVTTVPPAPPDLLKKTGSESNLLAKMGLGMSAASSGSLTSLATVKNNNDQQQQQQQPLTEGQLYNNSTLIVANQKTVSKIYETDIL